MFLFCFSVADLGSGSVIGVQEIAALEEELRIKDDLMQRQLQLVSKWKQLLRSQNAASTEELVKV